MPATTSGPGRARPAEHAAGWRLTIDWTACDGRGWCVELLPELLTQDRWGYPIAVPDAERARAAREGAHGAATPPTREIPVPAPLAAHAQRAVDTCPRLALRLRQAS